MAILAINSIYIAMIAENFKCPVDYVKCPGSFCLERSFLCDGDRQCPGGEDEIGCCKSVCLIKYFCKSL